MKIAEVIGTVTLSRSHPSFEAARLKLTVPYTLEELAADTSPQGEPLVIWDETGAGIGSKVAVAEGPEAAQPFRPKVIPVDAYAAALLDHVNISADEAKEHLS